MEVSYLYAMTMHVLTIPGAIFIYFLGTEVQLLVYKVYFRCIFMVYQFELFYITI